MTSLTNAQINAGLVPASLSTSTRSQQCQFVIALGGYRDLFIQFFEKLKLTNSQQFINTTTLVLSPSWATVTPNIQLNRNQQIMFYNYLITSNAASGYAYLLRQSRQVNNCKRN